MPESIEDSAPPCEPSTWYSDGDADGFGDVTASQISCSQPPGFVADATDCNDAAFAVFPGAVETCDGLDNNCDGSMDESSAIDAGIWYADGDADGFGDGGSSLSSCAQPPGFVADATDCNDSDPVIHPFVRDLPADGVDQNCDGLDGFTDDVVCGSFTTLVEAFALFSAGPPLLDTSPVESLVETCTVTDTDVTGFHEYTGFEDSFYQGSTSVGTSTVSCTEASDGIYATGGGESFDQSYLSWDRQANAEEDWGDSSTSLSFYAEAPQSGSLDPYLLRYSRSEDRAHWLELVLGDGTSSSESVVEVEAMLQNGTSRSYCYESSSSTTSWSSRWVESYDSWSYESESCTLN